MSTVCGARSLLPVFQTKPDVLNGGSSPNLVVKTNNFHIYPSLNQTVGMLGFAVGNRNLSNGQSIISTTQGPPDNRNALYVSLDQGDNGFRFSNLNTNIPNNS